MIRVEKYRLLALTLVVTFVLFNVGLPIVLASCPMMKGSSHSVCSMCCPDQVGTQSSGAKFVPQIDRSCCKTVIVAERNTNEFLQVKDNSTTLLSSSPILVQEEGFAFSVVPSLSYIHFSPLIAVHEDIPILTSSLRN